MLKTSLWLVAHDHHKLSTLKLDAVVGPCCRLRHGQMPCLTVSEPWTVAIALDTGARMIPPLASS